MEAKAPTPIQDFEFRDPALKQAALTHRSAGGSHNERLEFLGDAVLNLVIADALYKALPAAEEGYLTRLRAHLVQGKTLAEIAAEMKLGRELELGPGELKSGGHHSASIQADAFEAVLGAIYCDAGFAVAQQQVLQIFESRLQNLPTEEELKDAKTRLQEFLQSQQRSRPAYSVIQESGPQHRKHFVIRCTIESEETLGQGNSRRQAEQDAAKKMLEHLQHD